MMTKKTLKAEDLDRFTGIENWYRHGLVRVRDKYIGDGFDIYAHYREPLVPIDQVQVFPFSAAGALRHEGNEGVERPGERRLGRE